MRFFFTEPFIYGVSDCGGEVKLSPTGTKIQNPNHHHAAPPLMTCQWTFELQENEKLAVTIPTFEVRSVIAHKCLVCHIPIPQFGNCDDAKDVGDWVEFTGPDGEVLKTMCGYSLEDAFVLESPPGKITMTMVSGPPKAGRYVNDFVFEVKSFGLLITPDIINTKGIREFFPNAEAIENTPCNTDLLATSEEAVLTSPGYPANYLDVTRDCYWNIRTDRLGRRVAIIFDDFEVTLT